MMHRVYNPKDEVTIGMVGKYVEYEDSYKSLKEALLHGAAGAQPEGEHDTGSKPKGWRAKTAIATTKRSWRATTASWCPAASASAASKAC